MKVTREGLKALIKECIVEVLQEGMGQALPVIREQRTSPMPSSQPRVHRRSDTLAAALTGAPAESRPVRRQVASAAAAPGTVLESIFAHTAATTLKTQGAAGHVAPSRVGNDEATAHADVYAQVISEHAPEDIFGEATDKWSKLAFQRPVLDRGTSPESVPAQGAPRRDPLDERAPTSRHAPATPLGFDPYNPRLDE